MQKQSKFTVRVITASAMCVALAFVLSLIPIPFKMPQGGSVSAFTMFFISLPGFFFGPVVGIVSGLTYGLLDFILNPYIVSPPQVIFDYFLAFGALGLSGFFSKKKHGLYIGYLTGVFGRFVFTTLSGVFFFFMYSDVAGAETMVLGDALKNWGVWLYSIGYNGSYIGVEAAITLVLLALPVFRKSLETVKKQALN